MVLATRLPPHSDRDSECSRSDRPISSRLENKEFETSHASIRTLYCFPNCQHYHRPPSVFIARRSQCSSKLHTVFSTSSDSALLQKGCLTNRRSSQSI